MGKLKTFVLYADQQEMIQELDDAQAGKVFKAIYKYVNTDELETFDDALSRVVYKSFINSILANTEKYEKRCERNKNNIQKRWNKEESTNVCDGIPNDTSGINGIPKDTNGKNGIPSNTNIKTKTKINTNTNIKTNTNTKTYIDANGKEVIIEVIE